MVNANMAPADPATALPKGGKVGFDAVGMKRLEDVCRNGFVQGKKAKQMCLKMLTQSLLFHRPSETSLLALFGNPLPRQQWEISPLLKSLS